MLLPIACFPGSGALARHKAVDASLLRPLQKLFLSWRPAK